LIFFSSIFCFPSTFLNRRWCFYKSRVVVAEWESSSKFYDSMVSWKFNRFEKKWITCHSQWLSREQSWCQEIFWKIQFCKEFEHHIFSFLFEIANKVVNLWFQLNVKAKSAISVELVWLFLPFATVLSIFIGFNFFFFNGYSL
jgi:hypothetical protein